MANGDGRSRAPYIIICASRIDAALAKNGFEMIKAASRGAADLVTYYGDKLTFADTQPISKLQHEMMDLVNGRTSEGTRANGWQGASEMVDEMFALLDALEKKMSSQQDSP